MWERLAKLNGEFKNIKKAKKEAKKIFICCQQINLLKKKKQRN